MQTPAIVYDRYKRDLWSAWCDRQRISAIGIFDPTPDAWARWHRIDQRFRREYDRAEHARHGETFHPLWCDHCQSR